MVWDLPQFVTNRPQISCRRYSGDQEFYHMEIGNIAEISDQKLYFGISLFKGGDGLLEPDSRFMTHIRPYGGLDMNFLKINYFWKIEIFIEK